MGITERLSGNRQFIEYLVVLGLLLIFFILSLGPIVEGDIFWHIKTGEWIWQHKAIPAEDPFSYTSQVVDPMRPGSQRYAIIMKGYWLSQLIFYGIWSFFGIAGIILLRAFISTAILTVIFFWIRRKKVGVELSVLFMVLIGFQTIGLSDRPQYLSTLFFVIAAMLIESIWEKSIGPADRAARWIMPTVMLSLLMLFWANMHGGFVMGVALILIYLGLGLRGQLRHGWNTKAATRYFIALSFPTLVTLLNPNTYILYTGLWHELRYGVQAVIVAEMKSPLSVAIIYGDYKPFFWLTVLITTIIFLLRIRHILEPGLVALFFFLSFALLVQRNIPFFLGLSPIIASEMDIIIRDRLRKTVRTVTAFFVLIFLIFFFLSKGTDDIPDLNIARGYFPESAAHFLKETRPFGNIFSTSEWGSYLILALPEYKVFSDGRRLMDDVELAEKDMLLASGKLINGLPQWRALLDAYRIETILIPSVSPLMGDYFPLVEALFYDKDFSLVYQDQFSLIYLRNRGVNSELAGRHSLPKGISLVQAINRLHGLKSHLHRKRNLRIIAHLYSLLGKPDATAQYLRLANE
ncbi:MAG: hypothetical protein HZA17_11000 [Nitrospirae bacterium]|nr:hypothetical protein [Nitrospirota bacterium]